MMPPTFFGRMRLASKYSRTRSSAITRSAGEMLALRPATICRTCSREATGKFDWVMVKFEKSTSRSATETRVSASTTIVPSSGSAAPFGVYATAACIVSRRCPSQLAICGS
ncbi:hypothetical protein D3C83_40670 [compost metagenome]